MNHPFRSRISIAGRSCWLVAMIVWVHSIGLGIGIHQVSFSQEPEPSVQPSEVGDPPEKTPDVLEPGTRPDTIRDADGERIFVPKSMYEEFERFLRDQASAANANVSSEALEQLDVFISVDKNIARFKIEARAKLVSENRRWLSIPIGLGLVQAVPSAVPGDNKATFPPLRIASDLPGYIWKIAPGDELERKLSFEAISNIAVTSQGQSMRLDLPNVPCSIRLELPNGEWDFDLMGTGSEVVEPFREVGQMAVATARTSGGNVTLTWSKKLVADQIQSLEIESQTTYSPANEPGQFRAISNLAIRGPKPLGGRRFLITLPKDSQWRESVASPVPFPGYRFSKQNADANPNLTTLLLEFEEAVSRTEIEIPLEWQSSLSSEQSQANFAIPQVEGVQRHVGLLNLVVPRNVKFQWEPQASVQFVKQLQATDGSDALTYSFRLAQQTEPVVAQWNVAERVSNLKADYSLTLDQPTIQLSGTIEIMGDIRSMPFLQMDVMDWTVDSIVLQPSGRELDLTTIRKGTVDVNGGASEVSSIPLSLGELLESSSPPVSTSPIASTVSDSMPMPSDASVPAAIGVTRDESARGVLRSLRFVCSRNLSSADEAKLPFSIALPTLSWIDTETQKRLSVCVGGDLTLQSNTAYLTQTSTSESIALSNDGPAWSPESSAADRNQPNHLRSVLRYRVTDSNNWSRWSGVAETAGAKIRARSETTLVMDSESVDLSQSWNLNSIGRRAKSLRLAVPKIWVTGQMVEGLAVSIDDTPVSLTVVDEPPSFSANGMFTPALLARYAWVRLTLPDMTAAPNLAREQLLVVRKRWNHDPFAPDKSLGFDWALPFLVADQANDRLLVEQSTGDIQFSQNMECELRSPKETSKEDTNGVVTTTDLKSHRFDHTDLPPTLLGLFRMIDADQPANIDVESVWLQSILNAVEQRERFVVRFKTKAKSISIKMPANRIGESKILLDGRKAIASLNSSDGQTIDIALNSNDAENSAAVDSVHVLEVFSWPSTSVQWITTLEAEPPTILHCNSRSPFIWQIMVPTTEHLIGSSSNLSPGYRWQWRDLWFGRKNDRTQDQLEHLLGASIQPIVSQQTNQYVLFSLDHRSPIKVWLAPRYLMWGPIALCVLICAFLVSEFRWIRRPWLGVLLVLVGLAFSQWAWDLSVTIGQCLVAAIGIALLYATLKWVVDRRSRRRSVFATRPSTSLFPSVSRSASPSGSSRAISNGATATAPPALNAAMIEPVAFNNDATDEAR